ncbi:MAG: response regulator [Desulfobacteraceae bacterium]|nr:response regulator [Desulfobacteraceae bacterium]
MTPKKRILIIDDEFAIRESFGSFFEDEDYIVFLAENGQVGLDIFFKEKIDIVLTDLRMPVKDGLEVMKAIHKERPDTPMIVVSGAGRQDDIIEALRMGAKDYITKPVEDIEILSHVVRQVLENAALLEENRLYRKRLEKSERRYRTITENIAEGVFTVDENKQISYSNQAFCDMLGFSNQKLFQKKIEEITTPDSFKEFIKHISSPNTGLSSRFSMEMLDKNGQVVHVEMACNRVYNDDNQYKSTIAIVRDITKTTKLKKKYQQFLLREEASSDDLLAICANCKNIRDENEKWVQVEDYFSDVVFSHGICPTCCAKLYPDFDLSQLDDSTDPNTD